MIDFAETLSAPELGSYMEVKLPSGDVTVVLLPLFPTAIVDDASASMSFAESMKSSPIAVAWEPELASVADSLPLTPTFAPKSASIELAAVVTTPISPSSLHSFITADGVSLPSSMNDLLNVARTVLPYLICISSPVISTFCPPVAFPFVVATCAPSESAQKYHDVLAAVSLAELIAFASMGVVVVTVLSVHVTCERVQIYFPSDHSG